jgi:hypothetical protein
MSTSHATTNTSVNALAAYGAVDPYAAAASDIGATSGDVIYLRFDGNIGQFSKGGIPVPLGTRLGVNPAETQRGWVCWKEKRPVDEILVRIVDGRPPLEPELPNHGPYAPPQPGQSQKDGWAEQVSVRAADLETGDTIVFKTSTKSAMIAIGNFLSSYSRQLRDHQGLFPVIELQARSFTSKATGHMKFAPEFRIVEWIAPEQLVAGYDESGYEEDPSASGAPEVEASRPEPAMAPATPPVRPAPVDRPAAATPPARPGGPRPRSF